MGHVFVDVEIVAKRALRLRMLVDTGATHTILPAELAERLGVVPHRRPLKVRLANGRSAKMKFASVLVRVEGREAGDIVLIAPRGSEPLLGVEALEGLGLAVDPRSGRLRATRTHGALLMRVAGRLAMTDRTAA